jgi:hypothetical protein
MIAVSLKDGEQLVELLLRKEADVNAKSDFSILFPFPFINRLQISATKQPYISPPQKQTSTSPGVF